MDPFTTPGAFSWCELSTPDPETAAGFYRDLFGWEVETMDMGTEPYRVVKAGGVQVGGIYRSPPEQPAPPHWGCYVTVADTDATAAKCVSLGGKVVVQPTDIPQVGRFAVLQDPQGAVVSVIAYAPQAGG